METHWKTPIRLSSCVPTFLVALTLSFVTAYTAEIVTLRHEAACILHSVANHMGVLLRSDVPTPEVRYSSTTTFSEFQSAVEAVSHMRPRTVSNSYFAGRNLIILTDDATYYQEGRSMDDSLAHEYTHFIQDQYGGGAGREDDDSKEREAAQVQFWFRKTFMSEHHPSVGDHLRACGASERPLLSPP